MAMEGSSAAGEPQSSPKRLRESTESEPDRPLTYALLQQALHQNQLDITHSFQESLHGFNQRAASVETSIEEHVGQTTKLLQAMTDRHCALEHTVARVDKTNSGILQRLELLEGKFATASFTTGPSTRTSDGEQKATVPRSSSGDSTPTKPLKTRCA